MSVINGARLHSIYPSSGVTSISPPSVRPARLRYLLGPGWHPYIWRQGFPYIAGTVLGLVHSKMNSRLTSPIYATLTLAQNPFIFARHSKDSYHLLPLSNTFHCPMGNTGPEHYREYPSLTHSSTAPPLGSLGSNSATTTSVGSRRS